MNFSTCFDDECLGFFYASGWLRDFEITKYFPETLCAKNKNIFKISTVPLLRFENFLAARISSAEKAFYLFNPLRPLLQDKSQSTFYNFFFSADDSVYK